MGLFLEIKTCCLSQSETDFFNLLSFIFDTKGKALIIDGALAMKFLIYLKISFTYV